MVTLQIVKETSTILKLQGKEYSCEQIMPVLGIFFMALFMLSFGEARILKCNRVESTEVTCELTHSRLLRKDITPITSEELQHADTEVSDGEDGTKYRLIVSTPNKKIPITNWSSVTLESSLGGINSFFNNSEQKSLNLQSDSRYFFYSIGGFFGLLGSGVITTPKSKRFCLFNKRSNQFCLEVYEFGSKIQTRKQILQEIKEAKVLQKTSEDGNKIYQTDLTLISGEEITLQSSDAPSSHYEITQSINQFLGVSDKV